MIKLNFKNKSNEVKIGLLFMVFILMVVGKTAQLISSFLSSDEAFILFDKRPFAEIFAGTSIQAGIATGIILTVFFLWLFQGLMKEYGIIKS